MSELIGDFNIWMSSPSGMTNGTVSVIALVFGILLIFLTIRLMSRRR